ncbi:MAG: hypothetical protein ABL871_19080 [Terricaulis sp.]
MKRGLGFALAAALCACAPAPVQMPAARAAEVLSLFAAGEGPANICSDGGRATLRGAVRSYAREMSLSGVAWPAIPGSTGEASTLTHVDVSVMIAFAAGFVRPNDFQDPARQLMMQASFRQLPEILSLRRAARVACEDVQALQQATARFVMEQARLVDMSRTAQVRGVGTETVNRLRRQSDRVNRAREDMQVMAEVVHTRMEEHPVLPRS